MHLFDSQSSMLRDAFKAQTDMQTELTLAKSNLQLALAAQIPWVSSVRDIYRRFHPHQKVLNHTRIRSDDREPPLQRLRTLTSLLQLLPPGRTGFYLAKFKATTDTVAHDLDEIRHLLVSLSAKTLWSPGNNSSMHRLWTLSLKVVYGFNSVTCSRTGKLSSSSSGTSGTSSVTYNISVST